MEILTYISVAIISSLGLFSGFIVGHYAKEELKQAQQYLRHGAALLCAIIFWIVLDSKLTSYATIVATIAAIVIFYAHIRLKLPLFWNLILGVLYNVATQTDHFALVSSLIFLYGLPCGSSAYERESWKAQILPTSAFLAVSIGIAILR